MNVDKIKLTEINEASYNPRFISDNDMSKLKNSLSTFGLVDPIIINLKNNTIIGGHQRYNALVELGQEDDVLLDKDYNLIRLGDVGWVFDDINLSIENDDYEKALNLALNKISGEWDNNKLENLLDELNINDFDLELTGFNDLEITELSLENDMIYRTEDLDNFEDEYKIPTVKIIECPSCHYKDEDNKFKTSTLEVDGLEVKNEEVEELIIDDEEVL